MSVEEGLYAVLDGRTAAEHRIYPRLPQGVNYPAIKYQRISSARRYDISASSVGVTEASFQINCLAETYSEAKALAAEVVSELSGYTGQWGDLQCRFCMFETDSDMESQDGDLITHWVMQRYTVWTNDK